MSFPTYLCDSDVAAMRGSWRTYRVDVTTRHGSLRTYDHGEDIPSIHSILCIGDQDELPIIISAISPQYIEREPRPRSVSRHRTDTDSKASASTKQSKR